MRNNLSGFPVNKTEPMVDIAEFARFVLTGLTATIANLTAIWFAREVMPLAGALLAGLAAGFTVSFGMSKFYAFRSLEIRRAPREAPRFVLVYGVGAALYYATGLAVARGLPPALLPPRLGELLGAACGAALMMVTSYLGHRFFTYRRAPATGAGDPSSAAERLVRSAGGRAHRTPRA